MRERVQFRNLPSGRWQPINRRRPGVVQTPFWRKFKLSIFASSVDVLEIFMTTTTLEYVNAQLVAHGFAPSGLCLDGTSNDDSARIVKCLLGLLAQRVVRKLHAVAPIVSLSVF